MAKKSKGFIQKNRQLDFNGDGRFPTLRIKNKDKFYLKKQRRLYEKKMCEEEINNLLNDVI